MSAIKKSTISEVIIQWQSDKSISLLPKSYVLGLEETLKVGDKVTARYNSKFLPAKVLHVGEPDEMEKKMREYQPEVAACGSSDSPKGRGHRVLKRKSLPDDFVSDVEESLKPQKQGNSQLQKRAKSSAGHDIIEMLLQQKSDDGSSKGAWMLQSESASETDLDPEVHTDTGENFWKRENQRLSKQLSEAEKKISELEEVNQTLVKGLPSVVAKLKGLLGNVGKMSAIQTPKSTANGMSGSRGSSPSPSPSPSLPNGSACPATSTGSSSLNEITIPSNVSQVHSEFLSSEIVDRAMAAKTPRKVVGSLMTALFTREEMAASSLTGKSAAENESRQKLDGAKVKEIIRITLSKFRNAEVSGLRAKIAERLNDERKAFNKGKADQKKADQEGQKDKIVEGTN